MKKLFCMILALIMVMSLCACGKKSSDHGQNDSFVNGNGTNQNAHTGNANVKAIEAALIGTWVPFNSNKYEDGSNIITFNADGTIDMLGETYTWEITSARSAEEGSIALYDGETKFYTAEYEIKDKVLNYLCFERVKGADDKYRLSDESSIYATGYYKESDFTIIEINSDNFADYFEIMEYSSVTKDSFGDVTQIEIYPGIALKEEYGKVHLSISQCAFEYSYHMFSKYNVSADKATGEYKYEEKVKDGNLHTEIGDCQQQGNLGDRYGDVFCYARIDSFPSDTISIDDEITVTRAIGTLYIYPPAE